MITTLKDFEKFLKICRKQGVSEASCNGVTIKLGSPPARRTKSSTTEDEIETDALTPDELMFYHLRDAGVNQ